MTVKIPYTRPSITDLEVQYTIDAATNGWGEHCYDYIYKFEDAFKAHLGVEYAIATSSCTGALHMGMAALGIGASDEVILADINWIATAAPIVHLEATPIFVDILPDTWCLDPDMVEGAITSRTKAIVAVHLYGNLCDMSRLLEIGAKYNIPVIEDAAEAIGSTYHGKPAGSIGTFGTFSFHGTKTITTGEGGMFVTNDPELYEQVLTLSSHGRARGEKKQFWSERVGFKYKMSNVEAALGLAQIERVEELIAEKRRIFETYARKLSDLPLTMNPEVEGEVNGYWMPNIVVDGGIPFDRDGLLKEFENDEIDGRVFFWPLSSLPMFDVVNNPNSASISPRAVNLPSYFDMSDAEIMRVVDKIRGVLS